MSRSWAADSGSAFHQVGHDGQQPVHVVAVLGTATLGAILAASYPAVVVLPDGPDASQRAAAHETLGGATAVAGSLPTGLAEQLLASARHAFDSGVALTAGMGGLLMVVAAVVAFVGLRRIRA